MLTAHDDVTAGDPYANFADYEVIPDDTDVFTVNGDSIKLNEEGLYEVILNVCYDKAHGDSGTVSLQLEGQKLVCTKRRLNCSDFGVSIVHTLYAAEGDDLAVAFSGTQGFSGLKADISIKHIAENDED